MTWDATARECWSVIEANARLCTQETHRARSLRRSLSRMLKYAPLDPFDTMAEAERMEDEDGGALSGGAQHLLTMQCNVCSLHSCLAGVKHTARASQVVQPLICPGMMALQACPRVVDCCCLCVKPLVFGCCTLKLHEVQGASEYTKG